MPMVFEEKNDQDHRVYVSSVKLVTNDPADAGNRIVLGIGAPNTRRIEYVMTKAQAAEVVQALQHFAGLK